MKQILIKAGSIQLIANLNESKIAGKIWEVLPIKSKAKLWGKEVYFEIPVDPTKEKSEADVSSGTIAYWPPGKCLCLFYGQKPYSPVIVVGKIDGNANLLSKVEEGKIIIVEKVGE